MFGIGIYLLICGGWKWWHGKQEWRLDEAAAGRDGVRSGLGLIGMALFFRVAAWLLSGIYD
jgi:hypothetical protein